MGRLADLALGGDFLQQSVHALQVLRWVLGDYREWCDSRRREEKTNLEGVDPACQFWFHTGVERETHLFPLVSRVYIKCILARVRVVLVVGKSWGLEEITECCMCGLG